MRILGIVLVIILVAAIGGHYVLWKQQTELFDANVERRIAELNQRHGADAVTFSYDAKKVGGYPFDSEVRYVNPKLSVTPSVYHNHEMTLESYMLDGELIIRNNFIANRFSIGMQGASDMRGAQHDMPYAYKMTWDGVQECGVKRSDSIIDFIRGDDKLSQVDDPRSAVDAISEVDCMVHALSVSDSIADKAVLKADNLAFTLDSKALSEHKHHLGLALTTKAMLFFQDQEAYLDDLRQSMAPLNDEQASIFAALERAKPLPMLDPQAGGAVDAEFNGVFEGSLDAMKAHPVLIDVQTFAMKNEHYVMDFPFRFTVNQEDGGVDIRHNGMMRYSKAYDGMLAESLEILIGVAQDETLELDEEMQETLDGLDYEALSALLPPFHDAGDIQSQMNMVVGKQNAFQFNPVGLHTKLYGLSIEGHAKMARDKEMDVRITCRSCDQLIYRLSRYGNNISRVMASAGELEEGKTVPKTAQQALYDFIHTLDTPHEQGKDVIVVTVTTGEQGMMMISGQPMPAVMMQAMGVLGPHFGHLMPQNMAQ